MQTVATALALPKVREHNKTLSGTELNPSKRNRASQAHRTVEQRLFSGIANALTMRGICTAMQTR
jgi:hypothetical protein